MLRATRLPDRAHRLRPVGVRAAIIMMLAATFLFAVDRVRAGDLTFEGRVRAQESIERVYYAHQLNASLPFEQAVRTESIRAKVVRYLKESRALEVFWNTPITSGALNGELARVARDTRAPDRLLELYAALGDDPLVIQECLIRPILAARLTRARFASDPTIQADARREIEALRSDILRGAFDPSADHARRAVLEIVRTELPPEQFDGRRALAPRTVGDVGDVQDSAESFSVEVLLAESARGFRSAVFSVPKQSWDAWLAAHEKELDPSAVQPVAGSLGELPWPASLPRAGWTPPHSPVEFGAQTAETAPCMPDDTWTPYLPGGRSWHSAVWTGSVMVIWGGTDDRGVLGTGGRYDPVTNSWTPTSMLGAPSARRQHVGIWTGSSMVVWGGTDGTQWLSTGGRYDPVADTWSPISTTYAPTPRAYLGDWSGSELLVWGSMEFTANTGGRYDPVADAWTPMSTANSPSPNHGYSLVWAGNALIVWGGVGNGITNTGGRYNPASDTWTPTSLTNAPTPRYGHSATWTGQEMIVWGGARLV